MINCRPAECIIVYCNKIILLRTRWVDGAEGEIVQSHIMFCCPASEAVGWRQMHYQCRGRLVGNK